MRPGLHFDHRVMDAIAVQQRRCPDDELQSEATSLWAEVQTLASSVVKPSLKTLKARAAANDTTSPMTMVPGASSTDVLAPASSSNERFARNGSALGGSGEPPLRKTPATCGGNATASWAGVR